MELGSSVAFSLLLSWAQLPTPALIRTQSAGGWYPRYPWYVQVCVEIYLFDCLIGYDVPLLNDMYEDGKDGQIAGRSD